MTRKQALTEAGYCIYASIKDILDAGSLLRETNDEHVRLGLAEGNEDWLDIRDAIFTAEDAAKHARKLIEAAA